MLSGVLSSQQAIEVNISIMRAFVKLKEMISTHRALTQQLKQLERKVGQHDEDIQSVFEAIHQIMKPPIKPKRKIGFHP